MEAFLASVFRAPPRAVPGPRGTPLSGLPLFHGRRRRRPSSSVVCMAEPYLIAKLDSAEKAWKEMSIRLADPDIVSDPSEYQKLAQSVSELDQDTRITTLIRRNMALEEQLSAALASKDEAEKNLSLVIDSKDELEKRFADKDREVEALKEKATGLELAQEESNNLSNTVHADNMRLEREVAFLKAVMDETQKELHSTRGVLAGERARAFQLQVEVFHLKQHLQTMEGRSPTP